ncbi:MAG: hypothetical protein H0U75_05670 [Legionella sp.]|nr:hypothetical protein [Legionella sp.]
MSNQDQLDILNRLFSKLQKEAVVFHQRTKSGSYEEANMRLNQYLVSAERELSYAFSNYNTHSTEYGDPIARDEVAELMKIINNYITYLKLEKSYVIEVIAAGLKNNHISLENQYEEKIAVEREYYVKLSQLLLLKNEPECYQGVRDELDAFISDIKCFHKNKSMSTIELIEILDVTFARLIGGSEKDFKAYANTLNNSDSIPRKILGAALLILGAALIASAIFFSPAVITSASVGLGLIQASTAAATLASSALIISGTSFFSKTKSMQLADKMKNLNQPTLDTNHYEANNQYR